MRHQAAAAQIAICNLMSEVGEKPHLSDMIAVLRKDLEFYNRVVDVIDLIIDDEWDWIQVEPYIMDDVNTNT